jgi:hypothetical protein
VAQLVAKEQEVALQLELVQALVLELGRLFRFLVSQQRPLLLQELLFLFPQLLVLQQQQLQLQQQQQLQPDSLRALHLEK